MYSQQAISTKLQEQSFKPTPGGSHGYDVQASSFFFASAYESGLPVLPLLLHLPTAFYTWTQ